MTNDDDICPVCEARISPDASTCETCGADIALLKSGSKAVYVCPECGNELLEHEVKCPKCGVVLAAENASPSATEGENAEEVVFECPVCGAQVAGDANKCQSCGVEFLSEEEASVPDDIQKTVNSVPAVEPMSAPDLAGLDADTQLTTHEAVIEKVEESMANRNSETGAAISDEQTAHETVGPLIEEGPNPPGPIERDDVQASHEAGVAPAGNKEEKERKGLFGFKFGGKLKERKPVQPPKSSRTGQTSVAAVSAGQDVPTVSAGTAPLQTHPPSTQAEDADMRRVVQEIRPLLKFAGSVSADITESKQYLDMALENLQDGKHAEAGKYARLAKASITSSIQGHFSEKIEIMRRQLEIDGAGGERKKFLESRIAEVSPLVRGGRYDEAQKLTVEFQSEMSAKASQYGDAQEHCDELEQLLNCADEIGIDYDSSRMIYNEARKHLATGDWSSALLLAKQSRDSLMRSIPTKLSDEMKKAKNEIIDAKINGLQVGDLIAILKQASSTYNEGKYDESLRYVSHLRRQFTKLHSG